MKDIVLTKETVEELFREKRYGRLRNELMSQNHADIAELYRTLPHAMRPIVYRLLPKETAAEVFVLLEARDREALIDSFADAEIGALVNDLYMDDVADLVEEMPASVVRRILKNASPETRADLNLLLRYPRDSAGTVMTTEYTALRAGMTVTEAFSELRRVAVDKETIYTAYVIDKERHLVGIVTVKDMLLADENACIGDFMNCNVIAATTDTDREEVARMFVKYGFLAIPVTDKEERLVGIVTVDDAMDVLSEETEEDIQKMTGITPDTRAYFETSVLSVYRSRIPWLLLLMLTATLTGAIIAGFESALAASMILTAFIPMLMDTGGNAGSQASVTVIRALSLGEVEARDIFRVLLKEMRVALLSGITVALFAFAKILVIDHLLLGNLDAASLPIVTAAVVALTLMITVIAAKCIGCSLPLIAKRFGFDPAVMASPFITTIVDAVALLVYFRIASTFLLPLL